jgi:hypothetical protein
VTLVDASIVAGTDAVLVDSQATLDVTLSDLSGQHGVHFQEDGNDVTLKRSELLGTSAGIRMRNSGPNCCDESINNLLILSRNRIAGLAGLVAYGSRVVAAGNVFDLQSTGGTAIGLYNDTSSGPSHAELTHNVIVGATTGISILRNNAVHLVNNVIDVRGSSAANAISISGTSSISVRALNNDVLANLEACLVEQTAFGSDWCVYDLDDFNACQWATCEQAAGNISAPPRFVSPATGNFRLQLDSPLIDRGLDLMSAFDRASYPGGAVGRFAASLSLRDVDGELRPRGAGWDVGADEY